MKKINIYQFKHLFLLVLLSLAAQAVVAQGWTQVFYHGTFGGAYEADGVYISAMPLLFPKVLLISSAWFR